MELLFKRLKQGLQLHVLPVKLWERAQAYVLPQRRQDPRTVPDRGRENEAGGSSIVQVADTVEALQQFPCVGRRVVQGRYSRAAELRRSGRRRTRFTT